MINQKQRRERIRQCALVYYQFTLTTFLMSNHNLLPFYMHSLKFFNCFWCNRGMCSLLQIVIFIGQNFRISLISVNRPKTRMRKNRSMYSCLLSVCSNCRYAFQMSNLDLFPGLCNLKNLFENFLKVWNFFKTVKTFLNFGRLLFLLDKISKF